jgi:N-methylhydantoinase B/oxoprolinase/acetone carboxylase alpha subunit
MAATKTAKRGTSTSRSKKARSSTKAGSSKSSAKTASSTQSKSSTKQGRSAKSSASLKAGDKVEWSTPQGKTRGTVKGKVTKDTKVKDFKVKASSSNPKVMVQSDKTGKKAAHSAKSLKKVGKK